MLHLALCLRMKMLEVVGITMDRKKQLDGTIKLVATNEDLVKIKIVPKSKRARKNEKLPIGNSRILQISRLIALSREMPMVCKDGALRKPLTKNRTIICLTHEKSTRKPYKDNLCLFRSLALYSHRKRRT